MELDVTCMTWEDETSINAAGEEGVDEVQDDVLELESGND